MLVFPTDVGPDMHSEASDSFLKPFSLEIQSITDVRAQCKQFQHVVIDLLFLLKAAKL